jgi:hypothetical protein
MFGRYCSQIVPNFRMQILAHGILGPRNFALVLIGLGIGALLPATVQHRRDLRTLEAYTDRFRGPRPQSSRRSCRCWESSPSSSSFCVIDACGGVGQANSCLDQDVPVRPL